MKRVGRILHRLLTALSLLLLPACAGVWVRSYSVSDKLDWYNWPEDRSFLDIQFIHCSRGGVEFTAAHFFSSGLHVANGIHFAHYRHPATMYPLFSDSLSPGFSPEPRRYAALGFEWIPRSAGKLKSSDPIDTVFQSLTLPLYFPTLLFALLPAHYLLFVRRRRRRIAKRLALGLCPSCGYDMRATSQRCPECGREGPTASVHA
jgi:hypothetical protein